METVSFHNEDQMLLNSYWTRSNPLCKILGVRKRYWTASAEFNIIFP